MATIWAVCTPFLQNRSQVLVLPLTTDGNILNPILARTKTMYPDNYQAYHRKAISGELHLGQTLLHRVPKQQAGLMCGTDTVSCIANLMIGEFAQHSVSIRVLERCLKNLYPLVYDLVRYRGVRRVAFFATPVLTVSEEMSAKMLMDLWQTIFEPLPKASIEIFMSRTDFKSLT